MSIDIEPLLLAILTGIGFGIIVHWVWDWTAGKVAVVLALLWLLQTFAQQLWRILDHIGTWEEATIVGSYRLAFALAAIVVVGILHRRCE